MGVIIGVIGVIYLLCFIPVSYSNECGAPLIISDDQLIASSQMGHKAEHGRLNGSRAWRPNDHYGADSAVGAYIQVTFDTLVKVTKIATQGRNPGDGKGNAEDNEYVTRYKVQYGNNEDSWMYIRNADGTEDMVFTGNEDRGGTVEQVLPTAVLLKRLKIEIVECSVQGCALRFALYGCQVPVCEVLVWPTNGRVTNSGTDFTGSQTIECNDGLTPIGETSTVCSFTGSGGSTGWATDISSTSCVPVCGALNEPMNGHVTNTQTTVFTNGDMQMIECYDGFTAMGEISTVCTANGNVASWEPDTSSTTCVPVCGALNEPMYGHVTKTQTTVFMIGDMQTIECDDGFTAMGQTSTVCTANGDAASWEPNTSSTTCVPVCGALNEPMYGHVTNTQTTVFMIGDMQTIECDDGFAAMGHTSTVCTANGDAASWEPDTSSTTCVPVCGALNEPMYGHVTNTQTTVFMIGDIQTIECDDGFTAMGQTSTVCTANGDEASWEPDTSSTTCVPVCVVLDAPMNGHVTNTPTTVFTIDDMQIIECDDGFTAMGETSTVCTATGNAASWEPDTSSTTCANTTTSAANTGFNKSRGAVAGPVIGVLLIIVILIIVVIWLRKRKRETAKSTPQSGQAFDGPYELTIEGNNGPAKTQPTVVGQPNQEEYAYVDVNKANTPQNEVKSDTGDIYQDVQDKPDEYAYAYADVNASKTADEPSDDGLVHIYAKSKHGGRPITKDKQNPAADSGDIYQTIQEDQNENEYAYADVKVDANGKPANPHGKPANPQEGWEDNVIYAAGDDDEGIAADKGKEGWVDNNIYATTDNDEQNAEGKSQVEGWEDNIIYGDK